VRRLFWLSLGASLAVLIMRKLSRAAAKLTPKGIADSLGAGISDLAASLGEFTAEVRSAMASREQELRAAAQLDAPGGSRPAARHTDTAS
jgi:hypothetical protein